MSINSLTPGDWDGLRALALRRLRRWWPGLRSHHEDIAQDALLAAAAAHKKGKPWQWVVATVVYHCKRPRPAPPLASPPLPGYALGKRWSAEQSLPAQGFWPWRVAIEEQGRTISEVAEAVGVPLHAMSSYLGGRYRPPEDIRQKIVTLLGFQE